MNMPKVTFMPMNQECEAKEGETLLEVALNNEIPIMHACGGFCACTTCHCLVLEKPESLGPIEDDEEERIEFAEGVKDNSRLACQAKVIGDLTVQVVNIE